MARRGVAVGAGAAVGGYVDAPAANGSAPTRRTMRLSPTGYLWLLVAVEVAAVAWLRYHFRDYHGG